MVNQECFEEISLTLMSNCVCKKSTCYFYFKLNPPYYLNPKLNFFSGENEELGPPPSVDEAADALMTRLGFLLGDKIHPGEPGSSYHAQDDGEVISSAQNALNCTASVFCNIYKSILKELVLFRKTIILTV